MGCILADFFICELSSKVVLWIFFCPDFVMFADIWWVGASIIVQNAKYTSVLAAITN